MGQDWKGCQGPKQQAVQDHDGWEQENDHEKQETSEKDSWAHLSKSARKWNISQLAVLILIPYEMHHSKKTNQLEGRNSIKLDMWSI